MSNPVCKTLKKLDKVQKFKDVSFYIQPNGKYQFYGSNDGLTHWYDCKQTKDGPMCMKVGPANMAMFYPDADKVKNGLVFTGRDIKDGVRFHCAGEENK